MKRFNAFRLMLALGAVAATAVVFAVPAMAGNGIKIMTLNTNPTPVAAIPGVSGYDFSFWNGNGVIQNFAPTSYDEVIWPNGVHDEVLTGTVANTTGKRVTYTANSGGPIPAGQTCWDFANGNESTAWLLTIGADGHYILACHFPKV